MFLLEQCIDLLKDMEWSSYQRGQGWGPMGSGNDGPMVPACPRCRGVQPGSRGAGGFIESARGHKKTCDLAAIIKKFEEES